jgi:hypothetical protein
MTGKGMGMSQEWTNAFAVFIMSASLWLLWRIEEHLKAIRASLVVIANSTRDTADGTSYLSAITSSTDKTKTLLERAVKKQWGSAIDLE